MLKPSLETCTSNPSSYHPDSHFSHQSNNINLFSTFRPNPQMNVSASLNIFRLITSPALCLPQATIPTFNHLPIPLGNAFAVGQKGQKPDIRAIVLDKDNCFAKAKENVVWGEYEVSKI